MGSARYERELVNTLADLGYGVLRAPTSGAVTERALPDILAGEPIHGPEGFSGRPCSRCMAIEHKSTSATTAYVDDDEVEALEMFADAFGAEVFLAARYTTRATDRGHYLVRPRNARRTDGGAYGLPVSDIDERATTVFYPGGDDDA